MINRIADALIAYQDKESTLLPSLKQQLRECEKSIQNMLNAIEAGIITPSTKQRLQDLEARLEELNVSILQEQLQKPRFTKEQIVAWISRFKYGDPAGSAQHWQCWGQRFESAMLHEPKSLEMQGFRLSFCP